MGMISLKIWFFTLAGVVGLLFVLGLVGPGGLYWNTKPKGCLSQRYWVTEEWRTFYSLGSLEYRYKPVKWVCAPVDEFDAKTKDFTIPPK